MTYKELYESAADKLEKSKITLGEFEKVIEPLNAEIDTDSDTISRAKAIEALHTWFRNGFDEDRWWNSTHVLAVIEGLPPTPPAQPAPSQVAKDIARIVENGQDMRVIGQPERIIHCKDCEWWTKQECSPQGRCALSGMYPTGGWFCGNARMREVTDGNHN